MVTLKPRQYLIQNFNNFYHYPMQYFIIHSKKTKECTEVNENCHNLVGEIVTMCNVLLHERR